VPIPVKSMLSTPPTIPDIMLHDSRAGRRPLSSEPLPLPGRIFQPIRGQSPLSHEHRRVAGSGRKNRRPWHAWRGNNGCCSPLRLIHSEPRPRRCAMTCFWLYSSGSTGGGPKHGLHVHASLIVDRAPCTRRPNASVLEGKATGRGGGRVQRVFCGPTGFGVKSLTFFFPLAVARTAVWLDAEPNHA